jgi:hypothetical protein
MSKRPILIFFKCSTFKFFQIKISKYIYITSPKSFIALTNVFQDFSCARLLKSFFKDEWNCFDLSSLCCCGFSWPDN